MSAPATHYLPEGMPVPEADELNAPFWKGLREEKLLLQRCAACQTWQFDAEYLCHRCHAFDPPWAEVEPRGVIYSWQRVWHPVRPALKEHGPYLIILVELSQAPGVRLVGNLLGDPMQEVVIGARVSGVFEHHARPGSGAAAPYTLLQWKLAP